MRNELPQSRERRLAHLVQPQVDVSEGRAARLPGEAARQALHPGIKERVVRQIQVLQLWGQPHRGLSKGIVAEIEVHELVTALQSLEKAGASLGKQLVLTDGEAR